MNRITRSLLFATASHGSRSCVNSTIPYMAHVLDAYQMLAGVTNNEAVLVALLLHDTLQYNQVSIEFIEESFGADIASILAPLQSIDKLDKPDQWPNKGVGIIEQITLHFIEEEATADQLLLLASVMIPNIKATQDTFLNREWPSFPEDQVEQHDSLFEGEITRLSREKRNSIAYYEAIAESFKTRTEEVPSLEPLIDQLNGKAYWFLRC